jgi:hypothetical protein
MWSEGGGKGGGARSSKRRALPSVHLRTPVSPCRKTSSAALRRGRIIAARVRTGWRGSRSLHDDPEKAAWWVRRRRSPGSVCVFAAVAHVRCWVGWVGIHVQFMFNKRTLAQSSLSLRLLLIPAVFALILLFGMIVHSVRTGYCSINIASMAHAQSHALTSTCTHARAYTHAHALTRARTHSHTRKCTRAHANAHAHAHMHTRPCSRARTRKRTRAHTRTCVHTHMRTRARTRAHAHSLTHARARARMHTRTRARTCTQTHTRTHTRARAHARTHTRAHTRTCVHTHMRTR